MVLRAANFLEATCRHIVELEVTPPALISDNGVKRLRFPTDRICHNMLDAAMCLRRPFRMTNAIEGMQGDIPEREADGQPRSPELMSLVLGDNATAVNELGPASATVSFTGHTVSSGP